jgi:hypothetical protein
MLVGVNDAQCLGCGARRPGLFGLTALLRQSGLDDLFVPIVMWGCGALYLASLAMDPVASSGGGLCPALAAATRASSCWGERRRSRLRYGRWWTVLERLLAAREHAATSSST